MYKAISGFKVSGVPVNFLSCSDREDKPSHSRNSSAIESRRFSTNISSHSSREITASESSLLSANISSNSVKEVAESKSTLPLAPPVLPPTQNQNAHVGALVSYHPGKYAKASGIFSSSFKWECCQAKERKAPGCKSGPYIRYHPKEWDGLMWRCCVEDNRAIDGCQVKK